MISSPEPARAAKAGTVDLAGNQANNDLRREIADLRSDIAKAKSDICKCIVVMGLIQIGAIVALLKLIR